MKVNMGHYRSEMGFEEADKKEAEAKEQVLQKATNKIEKMIDNKGLARILAEIVSDKYFWAKVI